jgi:AcrR family transcriptional regulator
MEVVSHPKGKRLGGRSARINEAVLTATFQLLAEAGLKNFSIRAVSARANVHETSIYRRWGTPQSLILEACLHFMENAIPIEDTGSLRSDLVAISKRAMATLGGPQGKAVLALIRLADEKSLGAKRQYWQTRFRRLQPIFDRAISRGEFPGDADPVILLQTLIAPFYFRLLVTAEKLDDWPIVEQIDRLLSGYR